MDGMTYSKHFQHRFQQRGITSTVLRALLRYGVGRKCRNGCESLMFTKDALAEIRNDLGHGVFKACEKLRNTYIVVSEDSVLITVARAAGSHR